MAIPVTSAGVSALFIVLSLGVASAADKADRAFERMDANSDGVISQSEYDESRAQRFARWDRDDDGSVTKEEAQRKVNRRFDRIDANGDGVIQESEFIAVGQERFSKMDGDGNGQITNEEFKQALSEMRKKKNRN